MARVILSEKAQSTLWQIKYWQIPHACIRTYTNIHKNIICRLNINTLSDDEVAQTI